MTLPLAVSRYSPGKAMPHKGHYTAGVCILFDRPITIEAVEDSLGEFEIVNRSKQTEPENWMFGASSVTIAYRPEVNGLVSVDAVNQPWPDHMGDSKNESMLFGAWALGHFGPFAYPGGLLRASQQSWVWKEAKSVPKRHRAFVRMRASYLFGNASGDTPVMPKDYEPEAELRFVTKLAVAVLETPSAIAYFNPNGEVLRDAATLSEALQYAESESIPPLDAWCNVRLWNADAGWLVMDTVGNEQLDLPDIEVCVSGDAGYDLGQVDGFMRNVTDYILKNGEVIDDGDTMDGLGVRWRFHHRKNSLVSPPRRTLRAFPEDGTEPPAAMLVERED